MSLKAADQHKLLMKEFFQRSNLPADILKRKKEAFRNNNRIILSIIKNYSKKNRSFLARWSAFKKIMETPILSKKYFKTLARIIFR